MDPKPEIDPETGEKIIKPLIFCDSAMDNPQSFAYLKFSKENRNNVVKSTNFDLLKAGMVNDKIFGLKMGVKHNVNFIPDSMSKNWSSHVSAGVYSNNLIKSHFFTRYMFCFSSF